MEGMCLREQAKSNFFFYPFDKYFFECLLETMHCSRHQDSAVNRTDKNSYLLGDFMSSRNGRGQKRCKIGKI